MTLVFEPWSHILQLIWLVTLPIIWRIYQCLLHSTFTPLFPYVKSFWSHFCVMIAFQGYTLFWSFHSFLDLLCHPLVSVSMFHNALNDDFLIKSMLCFSSCWMMGDSLMHPFQWVSSHQNQLFLFYEWGLYFL